MISSMNNSQAHIPQSSDTANTKLSFDIPDISDTKASPNACIPYAKPKRPLIIVMHASVGSGHRSAANAIAQAFTLMRNEPTAKRADQNTDSDTATQSENSILENLEVEVLDVLDFGHIVFDGNKTTSLFTGAARPVYDLTWRFNFTGRVLWGGGTIWNRLMYSPFTKYVSEKQPIAIICTHITAANVAVAARMITGQHFPIVCVPTDYEVEGLWPHSATDLFCVANESMAETLRPRKVNDKRILITGIPTRDDFHRTYDRTAVRKALGLPLEKYNILILAGANLPRPYVRFRAALDKLLPYLHNFSASLHFTFIAGSDKEYAQHIRTKYEEFCLTNVTVLNYVNDMAALMAASDLAICKPGGLTVTECLCAQIPMLLVGKAYGQEKVNMQMLTSLGAALHVTTPRELFVALCRIAYNPDVTRAMLVNASFLRRPQAARDIASATLRLTSSPKAAADPLYRKHFLHFYWGDKPAHTR